MNRVAIAVCLIATLSTSAPATEESPPPPFKAVTGAFFAVSVPAMASSVHWYSEKLGLSVVLQVAGTPEVTVLEGGGLIVELIHDPAAGPRLDPPHLVHGPFKVGFVVQDFESTLAELRARGAEIAFGPYPPSGQQRANVIIRDNAGNLIQIFGAGLPTPTRQLMWGNVKSRWR
jgi:catechol 2,3-dioxygenase-like lactoylglutathione lyase family enzyme